MSKFPVMLLHFTYCPFCFLLCVYCVPSSCHFYFTFPKNRHWLYISNFFFILYFRLILFFTCFYTGVLPQPSDLNILFWSFTHSLKSPLPLSDVPYLSKLVLRQDLQKTADATNASFKILRFAFQEFAAVTFHPAYDGLNSKSVAKST